MKLGILINLPEKFFFFNPKLPQKHKAEKESSVFQIWELFHLVLKSTNNVFKQ